MVCCWADTSCKIIIWEKKYKYKVNQDSDEGKREDEDTFLIKNRKK